MALMLVVFLAGSTPPEYIHDIFVHHTDDVDPVLKKGECGVVAKHHHCSFLGFEFTPFVTSEGATLIFEHITYLHAYSTSIYYFHFFRAHKVISLRGPPACIV